MYGLVFGVQGLRFGVKYFVVGVQDVGLMFQGLPACDAISATSHNCTFLN